MMRAQLKTRNDRTNKKKEKKKKTPWGVNKLFSSQGFKKLSELHE